MVYFGLRGNSLNIVISVVAATAFALQGYDQAVMNGLVTLPTFLHRFPDMKQSNIEGQCGVPNLSSHLGLLANFLATTLGTVVAIYEVGCALGAFSCAFLGDILGRRRTIFSAGCTALVGIILQTTPFSLGQLIVARIITGT